MGIIDLPSYYTYVSSTVAAQIREDSIPDGKYECKAVTGPPGSIRRIGKDPLGGCMMIASNNKKRERCCGKREDR